MTRFCATFLVIAILVASLPVSAQDMVSHKLLPPAAQLRVRAVPGLHATFDAPKAASDQPAEKHRHWSKGGKIMTFIGLGLAGAGTGALAYGVSHNNSTYCNPGSTCVAVDWQWTGVAWLAGGAALTVVGLTRHTND